MTSRYRSRRRRRDLNLLDREGCVAWNPRDREAAHRAEIERIATEHRTALTWKQCLDAM